MLTFHIHYNSQTDEPTHIIDDLTTSEVQQLKALLNGTISEHEHYRKAMSAMANVVRDKETKSVYWKEYFNATKNINKLAKIQAKVKRSLS
jgi:hypothetical protein